MKRKDFYKKLNAILDNCGDEMPQGSKRRPFLAYSWKKYYNRNNLNLADITKFKDIRNELIKKGKFGLYIWLISHRVD